MRSGSFLLIPRPLEAFDCGSQSMSKVLTSAAAREAARLMAVVVLPTPPFWLATAMTRPIKYSSFGYAPEYAQQAVESNGVGCAKLRCVPRGTHLTFCKSSLCSTWNTFSIFAEFA